MDSRTQQSDRPAGVVSPRQVSVVIASYNMARFLPLAIDSVLRQTYPAYEIHVVDDGSSDNTQEVLLRFADRPNVFCHVQPNRGQASAKNRGIRASRGEFIAFLDADDLWTPTKLELHLPAFDKNPRVGVVYTNYAHIDEEGHFIGSPRREYYSGWVSGRLLIDNFVTGMASIVRRGCFESVGVFDESLPMGIDYDLWLRISAEYEFLYLDEVTYLYRLWPGQMSRNSKKRMECAIRIMSRFLAGHPGLVEPRLVAEAWAHTYTTRGAVAFQQDGERSGALKDYLRALRYRPLYVPAWKGICRLLMP